MMAHLPLVTFESSEATLAHLNISTLRASEELFKLPPYLCDLEKLKQRIVARDNLTLEGERGYFQNGKDLIAAKALLPHGSFEPWCKENLKYSKSKAEATMRVVENFGYQLENVNVTDLPRPSLLYLLSSPSVPQEMRDKFLPRILKNEPKIGPLVRQAIKDHCNKEAGKEPQAAERAQARHRAIGFLVQRLGDDLGEFMVTAAAAGKIFDAAFGRELRGRADAIKAQSKPSDRNNTLIANSFDTDEGAPPDAVALEGAPTEPETTSINPHTAAGPHVAATKSPEIATSSASAPALNPTAQSVPSGKFDQFGNTQSFFRRTTSNVKTRGAAPQTKSPR